MNVAIPENRGWTNASTGWGRGFPIFPELADFFGFIRRANYKAWHPTRPETWVNVALISAE
jgi:hypothetical protein